MKFITKLIIGLFIIVLLVMVFNYFITKHKVKEIKVTEKAPIAKKFKILHIMSYHSPWEWTDSQFNGFKAAMKDLEIEYKVFQMNTKRKSTQEWKEKVGEEARDLIDNWKPDLVYTNDDNAQKYVTKYYINKDVPIVFSGVNAKPKEYGFDRSKNIAGVLEEEHFVETVHLLEEIIPNINKIAVITDDGPTWPEVISRIKEKVPNLLRGKEVIGYYTLYTFEEYKNKIKELYGKVDAIALLGVFTFKDKEGKNVQYQEVGKWTVENCKIPDFSFWDSRPPSGTLCAVAISGYEQGLAAGKIARGILIEGRSPSSYYFKPSIRGQPVISLARAKKLGIKIKTDLLLSAKIYNKFDWENK